MKTYLRLLIFLDRKYLSEQGNLRWFIAATANKHVTWYKQMILGGCIADISSLHVIQQRLQTQLTGDGRGERKHKLSGHCNRMYLLPGTGLLQIYNPSPVRHALLL